MSRILNVLLVLVTGLSLALAYWAYTGKQAALAELVALEGDVAELQGQVEEARSAAEAAQAELKAKGVGP